MQDSTDADTASTNDGASAAPGVAEASYVGFRKRVVAGLIDVVLIMAITFPLLYLIYGATYFQGQQSGFWHLMLRYVLPAVAVIAFWKYRAATPRKMVVGAKIVDASNFGAPSTGQLVGRYFAYVPSGLLLGLGYFWIIWDGRKQAWHDKLANTVVIRAQGTD